MGNILPSWRTRDLAADLFPRTFAGENEKSKGEPDFLKPITKSLLTQLEEYARRLSNARADAAAKLESQMKNINATLHSDADNSSKAIDRALEKIKKSEVLAAVCINEHQKELKALEGLYRQTTQKCVEENIGPFLTAAKKFQTDLDEYAANTQKLAKEGMACSTTACAMSVGRQFIQLHLSQSKTLTEDYIDMDLKGIMVVDAVRRCTTITVTKNADELSKFIDIILLCVQKKKGKGQK